MFKFKIVRDHFADPAWENEIPYMYLDSEGNVTVGIGCLLSTVASAQALGFVYRDDQVNAKGAKTASKGQTASAEAIAQDYQKVKTYAAEQKAAKSKDKYLATFFQSVTKLDLPREEIDRVFWERVQQFEKDLQRHFPDFEKYPPSAQLALLDMVFSLGTNGLITKFPTLVDAARRRNWTTAALECHRRGVHEGRNVRTAELFREAVGFEKARLENEKQRQVPRTRSRGWLDLIEPWLQQIEDTLKPLLRPRTQGGRK